MIDRFRHVLFLGAHPDDEMGCAGTLARLVEAGAQVEVMTFSDCEDQIPDGFSRDDLIDEWRDALILLGIERKHMRMWDIRNRNFPEHRQAVLDLLDARRFGSFLSPYDLILLPATSDAHQDHATVSAEGIRAFKHATILGYELPLNTVRASTWQGFVSLEDRHLELKAAHAATYRSQAAKPYMDPEFIRGLAKVRGLQASLPAAEAFEVVRWIA